MHVTVLQAVQFYVAICAYLPLMLIEAMWKCPCGKMFQSREYSGRRGVPVNTFITFLEETFLTVRNNEKICLLADVIQTQLQILTEQDQKYLSFLNPQYPFVLLTLYLTQLLFKGSMPSRAQHHALDLVKNIHSHGGGWKPPKILKNQ